MSLSKIAEFMKEYKHLTDKEKNNLKIMDKSKKFAKIGLKNTAIISGILVILVIGFFAFYKVLDSGKVSEASAACENMEGSAEKKEISEELQELNPLAEKELERESAKEETIKAEGETSESTETAEASATYQVLEDFKDWNGKCSGEMIVVNKDNFLPKGYTPKVKMCRGKEVACVACADLENMIDDAKKDGIKLWISSGYRSTELQTKLFNRQVEREKSKAVISQAEAERRAATVVARPGTSEHSTGLAIDFNGVEDNFYTTKEYEWLTKNAHKYGFIERYQKKWKNVTGVIYEPWHFRYVGKENAQKIKDSGLCLEKYVKNFKVGRK